MGRTLYLPWHKFIALLLLVFMLGTIFGVFSVNVKSASIDPTDLSTMKIFRNNMLVIISLLVIGTLTGGVYTLIVLFANGVIVGETLYSVFMTHGITPIVAGFLPHVGPELISIFLGGSISLIPFYLAVINKKELQPVKIYREIFLFVCIAVLFCWIGAYIEGTISSVY